MSNTAATATIREVLLRYLPLTTRQELIDGLGGPGWNFRAADFLPLVNDPDPDVRYIARALAWDDLQCAVADAAGA